LRLSSSLLEYKSFTCDCAKICKATYVLDLESFANELPFQLTIACSVMLKASEVVFLCEIDSCQDVSDNCTKLARRDNKDVHFVRKGKALRHPDTTAIRWCDIAPVS
jgi:hypothetical protein